MVLGIDEAGRGCVIGPMVVAGVVVEENRLADLSGLGVKDSKLLSPSQRSMLVDKLEGLIKNKQIIIVPADQIDRVSLNELDLQAIARLINKFQPGRVIFDVPTHPGGIDAFVKAVEYQLQCSTDLVGENKADKKFSIVSAASILAKVKRDRIIEKLKEEYGDFGSGYMSDPKTQQFLKAYYDKHKDFPDVVRRKWASVKRLLFEQQDFLQ